ncbi:uncharacterized protein LOC117180880 [Belonocnema kinseyi]|uniref:uncharacterized protein LOC117180880 n=1 Tax=Belonocnema kinseyi TaxID=2817044 RepID=UPI00143DD7FA|nr:uncharacterized protein LOC117180880 [Belonocnema kinseyi]
MEVQAEALSSIHRHPHKYAFQWRHTLSEGMARRNIMDVELRKFKKYKKSTRGKENLHGIPQNANFPSMVYSSEDIDIESNQDVQDYRSKVLQSEDLINNIMVQK